MKKFLWFCVFVTLGFIMFMVFWSSYYYLAKNNEVRIYDRFHTIDKMDNKNFNFWGIISPVQIERQEIVNDTVNFCNKVIYPCAPNFKVTPPAGNPEDFIANEITKSLSDTIAKIELKARLDYDKTSLSCRKSFCSSLRKINKPKILELKLIGTASPEAVKYGYVNSITPYHYEKENIILAKERLNRIQNNLEKRGIKVDEKIVREIQLTPSKFEKAKKHKEVLIYTRYVECRSKIVYQNIKIETMTLPILIPLWIYVGTVIFILTVLLIVIFSSFIFSLKINRFNLLIKSLFFKIGKILIPLLIWIIGLLIILFLIICIIFNQLIFWLILIVLSILIIFLFFRRNLLSIILLIFNFFNYIFGLIQKKFRKYWIIFRIWWRKKTKCQKILIFILSYSVLVTIFVIYLLIK